MLSNKRVLLVVGGGIAAYKSLDLVRRLRERGAVVRAIMTAGAQEFVTPLAFAALTGETVHTRLFDRDAEVAIGHIRLARESDMVVVAPATANLMAKMAYGIADDLATTVLLATTHPILIAPAMNPTMWSAPATQANLATLTERGVAVIGPNEGAMAEAESGPGRMAEPAEIADAVEGLLYGAPALTRAVVIPPKRATLPAPDTDEEAEAVDIAGPLAGLHVLVTSGPTHEAIDPVRYIANRSSGKQGHAIAAAAAAAGARVTLISGPVMIPDPPGVDVVHIESAREMLRAVETALPADIFIAAAAVADWRTSGTAVQKIKKVPGARGPTLALVENPDILATIARRRTGRPQLVVGFAAETENVVDNAIAKRGRKGCDWIVANDVSPDGGVMGGDLNTVHLVTGSGVEDWPTAAKDEVARRLVQRIAAVVTGG
jgi:phosphopantothenoylcysteine decarboxylase/phosphopantothenate--cysteine ligase